MNTYDYIIVGAGSAGCVLADHLSRDPARNVLLIEAGPDDDHPWVRMPKGYGRLLEKPQYMWYYQTVADSVAGVPAESWVRGRLLGGSSSINGMLYVRGQPQDYDGWEALGNPGWGWTEMSRIFTAMEHHALGGDGVRGGEGPLKVSVTPGGELTEAFIASAQAVGLARRDDLNRPDQEGVGYVSTTIWAGRRQSAALAFLKAAGKRKNLAVITDALIHAVSFDGRRASGVCGTQAGQPLRFTARREVILSAGTIESPALLQRSGIGPGAVLQSLGIQVLADSVGVGANLREHRLLLAQYRLRRPVSLNFDYSGWRLVRNVMLYQLASRGPMATGSFDCAAFVRTDPTLDRPDAQIVMAPFSLDLKSAGTAFEKHHGMICFGYPLRPQSQGSVMLQSADPAAPPVIRPNYLSAAYDRDVTVRMFRYQRRLMSQAALAPYMDIETRPGSQVETDEQIIEEFKRSGTPGYHAVGTCRMGPDGDGAAVVDSRLRVRGVSGLRVVDCSVMPTMVSGNTNAPVMALAWRAAELILEDAREPPEGL